MVYIRDNIVASRKKQRGNLLESVTFDLCIDQRYFVLISAYKPPSVDNTTFTSELTLLLDSLITSPTRISKNTVSCLDVILTNVLAFMKHSGVIETGLSDHCLVYAVLNRKLMHPQGRQNYKAIL